MTDLSAYVNFAATIDISGTTPVIVLSDVSSYPGGVIGTLTGVFSITQPDGVSVVGNFTNPDIYYSGGALTSLTKSYRLASNGEVQNGYHIVTYTVKATGYLDTVITKNINVQYSPVVMDLSTNFDVFTPILQAIDASLYTIPGYTLVNVNRSWSAVFTANGTVETVTGSSPLLDLNFSGYYYDSGYNLSLTSIVTYSNSWVTIIDKLSALLNADAYTPMTIAQLQTALDSLKQVAYSPTLCGYDAVTARASYNNAMSIYDLFWNRGINGSLVGLNIYEQQLERIFNPYAANPKAHTGAIIPPYSWGYATGGTSLPSTEIVVLSPGTSSYIIAAGKLLEKVLIIAPTRSTIGIGTAIGTNDIYDAQDCNPIGIMGGDHYFQAQTTLYFNTVKLDTIIKLYMR